MCLEACFTCPKIQISDKPENPYLSPHSYQHRLKGCMCAFCLRPTHHTETSYQNAKA